VTPRHDLNRDHAVPFFDELCALYCQSGFKNVVFNARAEALHLLCDHFHWCGLEINPQMLIRKHIWLDTSLLPDILLAKDEIIFVVLLSRLGSTERSLLLVHLYLINKLFKCH
jgi:hypothetical protein